MRYKVFVSNGHDTYSFYEVIKETAELLYRMAVESKLFEYVSLSKSVDKEVMLDEWSDAECPNCGAKMDGGNNNA